MAQTHRRRPWLAAGLAMMWPGLGHAYLREWFRAVLWLGLAISTIHFLVPAESVSSTTSIGGFLDNWAAIPLEAHLAITSVLLMNAADAYWVATASNYRAGAEEGLRCPNCGRELDEDLEFCHWCTAELSEFPEHDHGEHSPTDDLRAEESRGEH